MTTWIRWSLLVAALSSGTVAVADEAAESPPAKAASPGWPRVGGHFGLALAILTVDNDGSTFIGRDFVQVGVTPGVTLKLSDHWAIDFEFIGFSRWDRNPPGQPDKSHTIFVVDPGVVYNFGHFAAGLRLAVQIGEGIPLNFGVVPIIVVPFAITSRVSYFLELDLPVFVLGETAVASTADRVLGSFNVLFQTGFAF